MEDTIIIATPDELLSMYDRGELKETGHCITLNELFEFLCDHYGVQSHWSPNDVY